MTYPSGSLKNDFDDVERNTHSDISDCDGIPSTDEAGDGDVDAIVTACCATVGIRGASDTDAAPTSPLVKDLLATCESPMARVAGSLDQQVSFEA